MIDFVIYSYFAFFDCKTPPLYCQLSQNRASMSERSCLPRNNRSAISERRQKLWTLLTRGMKGYEIAKELGIAQSTVGRDIKYLAADSQKYLNDLAKETLPFMYQMDIEGIRQVLRECWNMYQSEDKSINWFQRLAALKLAKECYEADFKLLNEGPSVLSVRQLEERLMLIENRQIH